MRRGLVALLALLVAVNEVPVFDEALPAPPVVPVIAIQAAPAEPVLRPSVQSVAAARSTEAADPENCPSSADAVDRWLAAMQASGDDGTRAAGLLVGLADVDADPALRERLLTQAAGSNEPAVLAWGQRACAGADEPACAQLAPERWPEAEPDNAAAWLALAADARTDDATRDAAFHRAAAAPRFDAHMARLHAVAAAAEPPGLGAAADNVRLAMHQRIGAARSDWLATEALRRFCPGNLSVDDTRRLDCEAIAARIAAQPQSVPDLLQALELARRYDWPEEQRAALRDEAAALDALQTRRFGADAAADCAVPPGYAEYVGDVGKLGVVAALRARKE